MIPVMLSRDSILETLALLPVWTWPVFFWDLWWFERSYRGQGSGGLFA